MRLLRRYFCG